MRTNAWLDDLVARDAESYRKTAKNWRKAVETLDDLCSEDVRDGFGPDVTYKDFCDVCVTAEKANMVIASLVNECGWDGRISQQNREWAAGFEFAFDEQAMRRMSVFPRMHMAHLNQIADEARKAASNKQ